MSEVVLVTGKIKNLHGVRVDEATDGPDTARIFVAYKLPRHTIRIEIDSINTRIDLSRYNRPSHIAAPPVSLVSRSSGI